MYCEKCGTENRDGSVICSKCGNHLSSVSSLGSPERHFRFSPAEDLTAPDEIPGTSSAREAHLTDNTHCDSREITDDGHSGRLIGMGFGAVTKELISDEKENRCSFSKHEENSNEYLNNSTEEEAFEVPKVGNLRRKVFVAIFVAVAVVAAIFLPVKLFNEEESKKEFSEPKDVISAYYEGIKEKDFDRWVSICPEYAKDAMSKEDFEEDFKNVELISYEIVEHSQENVNDFKAYLDDKLATRGQDQINVVEVHLYKVLYKRTENGKELERVERRNVFKDETGKWYLDNFDVLVDFEDIN